MQIIGHDGVECFHNDSARQAARNQLASREAKVVLNSPEMQERFAKQGLSVVADSPESFSQFLKSEGKRWGDLINELGIKIN